MKKRRRKRTRIIRVHEGFYKYLKTLSELEQASIVDITRELSKKLREYVKRAEKC